MRSALEGRSNEAGATQYRRHAAQELCSSRAWWPEPQPLCAARCGHCGCPQRDGDAAVAADADNTAARRNGATGLWPWPRGMHERGVACMPGAVAARRGRSQRGCAAKQRSACMRRAGSEAAPLGGAQRVRRTALHAPLAALFNRGKPVGAEGLRGRGALG
jgi:hypothetical protein